MGQLQKFEGALARVIDSGALDTQLKLPISEICASLFGARVCLATCQDNSGLITSRILMISVITSHLSMSIQPGSCSYSKVA